MSDNARIYDKWHGYYLEDCECLLCLYYVKKHRCSLNICCCEEEKHDAVVSGRIERRKGSMTWDG